MTSSTEFPLDLKSLICDCVLALFWPRKKIIEFFEGCGADLEDLSSVRGPKAGLSRRDMVQEIFYQLNKRADHGYPAFQLMLTRLGEWTYFDPYWFNDQKKLDRAYAEERLAELRRMLSVRHFTAERHKATAQEAKKQRDSKKELSELLEYFNDLALGKMRPQQRGYEFEKFLRRLFEQQGVPMSEHFRLTGEEIDGSFKFEGENYLVEAKWQEAAISTEALYKFAYKAEGKMYGRGLFISVNAYSGESFSALVKGKHIKVILMDGQDIVLVLNQQISLLKLIDAKIRAAQVRGDVYVNPITGESKVDRMH